MIIKKGKYYIIILLPFLLLLFAPSVEVEAKNVLDCIEHEEDCEQDEEDEIVEQKDSEDISELVGKESFKASTLFFNIIKMILALLFILALIYIILLVLRKRNKLMQHHDLLQNLGGIPLGQNKSLQLVRIGSHVYVVGVGEHVDLMLEITEAEVLEALLDTENDGEDRNFLNSIFSRSKKESKDPNPFMSQLQDELKKLKKYRENLVDKATKKDDEHV